MEFLQSSTTVRSLAPGGFTKRPGRPHIHVKQEATAAALSAVEGGAGPADLTPPPFDPVANEGSASPAGQFRISMISKANHVRVKLQVPSELPPST